MYNYKSESMPTIEELTTFCKRKGFVFPSSEIHSPLSGFYDYGPLGVEMKRNITNLWWKTIVSNRADVVGIDGAIISPESVWKASGHVENFIDTIGACKKCKTKVKLDKHEIGIIKCPKCGIAYEDEGEINPMFETTVGSVKDQSSKAYLRPETAQMIYTNFKNILDTSRMKIPFGIAQIGKAFRNEISPRNFLFRMREFSQMEMQYFVKDKDASKLFKLWQKERMSWLISIGLDKKKLRFREHDEKELAHYAKKAIDIEFKFDFGWKEIEGIHNRGDWDMSQHEKFSKKDLKYFDQEAGKKFTPWIVETSAGLDRIFLALIANAYTEEKVKGEKRIVLKLNPEIAPYKVAIFPLMKKDGLPKIAKKVFDELKEKFHVFYDESGSIGRRYRRMDEIGTPFCITIDHDTKKDKSVTVRDRDSMKQKRVKINDLEKVLS